jgi:type I restriction enzyme S subunit
VSEVPNNWVSIPLGETVQIQKGKKPLDLGPLNTVRNIPYINISVFEGKTIKEYAPPQQIPRCEITDTLLVWDGARAGLCGRGVAGFIGSTLMKVTSDIVAPPYLYYFLQSHYGTLNTQTKGVGIPHIDPVVFNGLEFLLPPSKEQTRIVAKLEELLSDLDAGVAELKAAQKKLGQYRQSLLKAAVEGALTAEWRKGHTPQETGAQLLARILTERRARWEAKQLAKFAEQGKTPPKDWQKKYPEPVQPDTSDLPELPEGWVWASLDMLSEIQGGIQKQPSRAPIANKYPFLRVANVARGILKLDDIHEIELFKGELERLALQKGDVLIVEGNGSLTEIGRCALWDGSIPNTVHQNHLIRARPIGMRSEFVETWLNSLRGIERLTALAATTSGLYTLSVGKISKIPVPVPPIDEQTATVNLLATALDEQKRQEIAAQLSLKQSAAQRKNILKAAFSGQLIPQDPNDEPASMLLERICAERAERDKQPKVRKTKQQKEIAAVVSKLKDVLAEAGDWVPAQEVFRRCGVADGSQTEQIEALYAELRELDKAGSLAVEAVTDAQGRKLHDRLKLVAG